MNDCIGLEFFYQVLVRGKVMIGRRDIGIMQDFTDLAITPASRTTPFRLGHDENISI
ncbi:MAG: hypothetical protein BWY45_03522 [Euryarchaeota archaeon ADurb.Bin294]|nr:MAG: hypothetical protein BWY45_03522 [Euryarchaeota archaeon ADurb.Bin294]